MKGNSWDRNASLFVMALVAFSASGGSALAGDTDAEIRALKGRGSKMACFG